MIRLLVILAVALTACTTTAGCPVETQHGVVDHGIAVGPTGPACQ